MVGRLFRLRLALLGSAFRAPFSRALRHVLSGVLALALAFGAAWFPLQLVMSLTARNAVDTVVFGLVLLAATVMPFFVNRKHLEVRQFGTIPARTAGIGTSLLLSTILAWPALWLLAWLIALMMLRPEWQAQPWALVTMMLLTVFVAICGARVSSGISKLITSARARMAIRAIGSLIILVALPIGVFAIAETIREPGGSQTLEAASVFAWSPFGAPIAGVIAAVSGEIAAAITFFSLACAWIIVLLALWFTVASVSLTRVQRPVEPLLAARSMGWFDHLPSNPIGAIGARALTYWRRDPRYRVALAAAPIGAVLIVVALSIAGVDPQHVALIPLPLLMLLLGWSLHNDIATDSTAIWLHIVSGTRGYQDRLGRYAPALFVGVPIALVGSSITATVLGDWRVLPALIGMNLAVLLVSCGVSSVSSAVLPYPTTRPNDSPFMQPAVAGSGGGTAQTISMLVTLALSAVPVWIGVQAVLDPTPGAEALALVIGVGYGALISALGVLIGGAVFDRAGPVYIALTQTFD